HSQLNDAVRQVADARGYEIRARGIELDLDLAPDISYVAATVPELLFLTLQMVLWAEQALLAVPPREDGDLGTGVRIPPRMTLRTGLHEWEHSAQLTVTHDGPPLGADLLAALGRPGETLYLEGTHVDDAMDPTGAGDCFAGGFIGYLASRGVDAGAESVDFCELRRAVIYGSVMGSFCCEKFGVDRFRTLTRDEIEARYREFKEFTDF
ncbi:MAG: hypothetical protein M1436_07775, partial [Acidobacteria bacterium]|nr:hypothetical protein [Acidobacteriota bacterium]